MRREDLKTLDELGVEKISIMGVDMVEIADGKLDGLEIFILHVVFIGKRKASMRLAITVENFAQAIGTAGLLLAAKHLIAPDEDGPQSLGPPTP